MTNTHRAQITWPINCMDCVTAQQYLVVDGIGTCTRCSIELVRHDIDLEWGEVLSTVVDRRGREFWAFAHFDDCVDCAAGNIFAHDYNQPEDES